MFTDLTDITLSTGNAQFRFLGKEIGMNIVPWSDTVTITMNAKRGSIQKYTHETGYREIKFDSAFSILSYDEYTKCYTFKLSSLKYITL